MLSHIHDIDGGRLTSDVCVVGTGAAGLTLARELDRSPLRVVLLESGGRRVDERTQRLYRSDVVGLAHGGVHSMRFRVFGGTTTRWAGQALPLFDIDFERREWVPDSGWPLRRDELEPYYRRASELMSVPAFPRQPDGWPPVLAQPPAFDQALLFPFFSEFTAQPDFARAHGQGLAGSDNVEIVLGASVTELVPDPAVTHVQAARARSLEGAEVEVHADFFVLCCGGIEAPRILLASDRHCEGGLGNHSDLVGRYFQEHPNFVVGPIAPVDAKLVRATFSARRAAGVKFQPRFALSEGLQRSERTLACSGEVLFEAPARSSIDAGKALIQAMRRREMPSDVRALSRTVVGDPLPLLRAAARYFVLRQPARDTTGTPVLAIAGEQAPNRDSRIYLSDGRDELGVRRAVVDWRLTESEVRTCRRFAEVAALEFERLGLGAVEIESFALPDDPLELSGIAVDAGHHMGATRMAEDDSAGVVDSDCKVFGLDNTYIGSCSVFPTSGFSNPTFTLIALCIRIADAIKRRGLDG